MRLWLLIPLGVFAVCLLWVWVLNWRARVAGLTWPAGMDLGGPLSRPDLVYPGDVILGAEGVRFGTIQCRRLLIAKGAEVRAHRIVAVRVEVLGKLSGVETLTAAKRLVVNGELTVETVVTPRITLKRRARAVVLTVSGTPRVDRHPRSEAKGFFADFEEMRRAGAAPRGEGDALDTTDKVTALR